LGTGSARRREQLGERQGEVGQHVLARQHVVALGPPRRSAPNPAGLARFVAQPRCYARPPLDPERTPLHDAGAAMPDPNSPSPKPRPLQIRPLAERRNLVQKEDFAEVLPPVDGFLRWF
jgi:hypothetical protein